MQYGLQGVADKAVQRLTGVSGGRMTRVFEYKNEEKGLTFEAFTGELGEDDAVYFSLKKTF